ncbi:MAG: hypothetical protein ACI9PN_002362, partial [Candidatus Azotimanducaceae bacterium]
VGGFDVFSEAIDDIRFPELLNVIDNLVLVHTGGQ